MKTNTLVARKWQQIKAAASGMALAAGVLATRPALAAGGGGLPWEDPLELISDSLSGPVAVSVGIVGFVIAGAIWVFGNDLGDFGRRTIAIVLACSTLLLAKNFIESLFGTSGALF